ncbi:MAG TPA: hypothetical protein VML55_09805 [Planctomycetaceae bacterium]|nr:hypothetical protein [Planctomycetaceae bacterium]
METILTVLASVGPALAVAALAAGRRAVRGTSLTAAWRWAAGGTAAWAFVWGGVVTGRLSGGAADVAWYLVAVAMLCPPVAVLGARRPGSRAWNGFVVLPLLAVLSLPAVTAVVLASSATGARLGAFRLETPWAAGFGLVLVMGVGNYVGTRLTPTAVLYAAAAVLLTGPVTDGTGAVFPSAETCREWASLCLGLSAGLALGRGLGCASAASAGDGLDRLWRDFRNLYGVVWTRRVMDRVNETLAARTLPVGLEWSGLAWIGPPPEPVEPVMAEARQHAEQTVGWLLKRFVDPEWIATRLGRDGGAGAGGEGVTG